MPELFESYWPYFLAALLIGLAVAWFLFVANRKTSVTRGDAKDVLDEGAAPAQRNQALIDAPQKTASDNAANIAANPASPKAEPQPISAAAQESAEATPSPLKTEGLSDDLTVIKGLGPKLATMLNSLGITSYAQIAEWDDAEIDRIDAQLDRFAGRIRRDSWVDQAKLLADGDQAGFAQTFGQNG
ncbi:MAG: hypothetical protein ABJP48_07995 [Erythrobacter sp.]